MKNLILLDSDSNTIVFCNPEFADKIQDTKECVIIDTNREGQLESYQQYKVSHLSIQLYNEKLMINIIVLSDFTDRYKVIMNTDKEKAMIVYFPNKIVKFHQLDNQLWRLDPADKVSYLPYEKNKLNKITEKGESPKLSNLL